MALKILYRHRGTDWPFPARLSLCLHQPGGAGRGLCLKTSPLHAFVAAIHVCIAFRRCARCVSLAEAIAKAKPDLFIPCDDLMAELAWRLARADPSVAPLIKHSQRQRYRLSHSFGAQ